MAYASISGRARTDPKNPKAFGVCDRDGFWYNLEDLVWQFEFRGNDLTNTCFRVCRRCLDIPFELNRPLYLPPDPPPVDQPRVEAFAIDEQGPNDWDSPNIYYQPQENWDEGNGPNWDQSPNQGSGSDIE